MFTAKFGHLKFTTNNCHLVYDAHTFALQNKGEGLFFFLTASLLNLNYYLYFMDPSKFYLSLLPSLLMSGITLRIPMMNNTYVSEVKLMKNQEQVEIQMLNGKKDTPFIKHIRATGIDKDKLAFVYHKGDRPVKVMVSFSDTRVEAYDKALLYAICHP